MLFGDFAKGTEFAIPGVRQDNVNSSLLFSDDFVETIQVGQFSNVSLDPGNIVADGLHSRVQFLLAAARDKDISPLVDEDLRCGEPYPFGAAGDDCDLSTQFALTGLC